MRFVDTALEALRSLWSRRVRGAMAALGIVLGIAAVVGMASLLGGIRNAVVGDAGQLRMRLVSVSSIYGSGMGVSDVRAMERELSDYFETVSPSSSSIETLVYGDRTSNVMVVGCNSDAVSLLGARTAHGRFFTRAEAASGAAVVVLDEVCVRELIGGDGASAIGRRVSIGGDEFEVIGVVSQQEGVSLPGSARILVPFETLTQRRGLGTNVDEAQAIAREGIDVNEAADVAAGWLAERLRVPEEQRATAVVATTMQSTIDRFDYVSRIIMTLMVVGSSLTLVLGGVTVMYLMRASVAERRDEFVARRALGARQSDIALQVILEALCITLSGGVIGTLVGYGGVRLLVSAISSLIDPDGAMLFTPSISFGDFALVLGICLFIGLVFSSGAARRAARIDAAEGLGRG